MPDKIIWEDIIRTVTPKLSKDNFIEQIVKFGFFADQFPKCYSSNLLYEEIEQLLPLVPCTKRQAKNSKNNVTQSSTLSIRKNDIARRLLSIPNPKAFLRVSKYMQENWVSIQKYAESDNSLSPITYIHGYDNSLVTLLNNENIREEFRSKSSYIESFHNSIKASIGYKFRLKVDIANFYYSIYTHSIAWAICGKEEAKTYLRTKEPVSLKERYDFADNLDTFIRYMKNNETNGIIVGPFTSRIISEIILSAIDRQLDNEKYTFRRYVDDYKFYFRTKSAAQESLPKIERILNEYGLQLNSSKTVIEKYPYELLINMKSKFTDALKESGVFGVLNEASLLYLDGEKGAYKYALKLINNHPPNSNDFEVIMSTLINIVIIEPKYSRYVIGYLKEYMSEWKEEIISELINHELSFSLKNELQEESLVFLQILKELSLSISGSNINDVLNSNNDFAIIIALDYWKNRNKKVIRTRTEAKNINESIVRLSDSLRGEEYNGPRWLLLYESIFHKFFTKELIPKPKNDAFFDKMFELSVTFYIL